MKTYKTTIKIILMSLCVCFLMGLIAGCGGEAEPPSIGVFLKNPGEDYIKLVDVSFFKANTKAVNKIRRDMLTLPLAKDGAKVVFYDVNIPYSHLLLIDEHFQDRRVTVEKISEDTYVVNIPPDSLWTGLLGIGYHPFGVEYRTWFFRR